ncbi:hypothetical protein NP493_1984g00006 [Ridgeia piscesae]|uniref:Uncharacterized protein n=1 Tax=Ridgeia piscesae TaxID=27915 RepID=A0AAD9N607_RIDPI|nr:hypothetical protein NP493_1984g00006 [Ridgeia piscesae]
MLYPGATPDVQAYLYKCIYQPTLTYGLECMSSTAFQMRLKSVQGRLIKQSLGLGQLSHNTALLKALNIEKIEDIIKMCYPCIIEYLKLKFQRIDRCSTYCLVLYFMGNGTWNPA